MENYVSVYIIINVFCSLLAIIFGFHSTIGIGNIRTQRIFKITMLNLIIFFLSDVIWYLMDQAIIFQNIYISYILRTIYFASAIVNSFLWFLFFESVKNEKFINSDKAKMQSSIVGIIGILLLIVNIPTGIFFKISPDMVYTRGPAFWLLYILIYFYIAASSIASFIYAFHVSDRKNKIKFLILSAYPIFPGICGIIQYFMWSLPLLCTGLTLSVIIMYLSGMNDVISEDSLTGLVNRTQFYRKARRYFSGESDNENIYILLADLDKFKKINDNFGHLEGDKALVCVSNCLQQVFQSKKSIVCRYGGDEFLILISLSNEENIDNYIKLINENLNEYNKDINGYKLSLSIGISKKGKDGRYLRELISRADDNLYKIKKKRK